MLKGNNTEYCLTTEFMKHNLSEIYITNSSKLLLLHAEEEGKVTPSSIPNLTLQQCN